MAGSGEVVAITGSAQAVTQVFVVKANGQKIPLKIGDTVDPGDVVITPAGVKVEVRVDNGQVISIDGGQTVAMTAELLENGTSDAQSASSDGAAIQSVIQAINEGRDIGDVLEETAAGEGGGSGNEGGNDDVINLVRVIEQVGPPIEYVYPIGAPTAPPESLFSLPVELPPAGPADTTGPTNVTGFLPETAVDDTGVSQTDNLTNNKSPTLTGTTELSTDTVVVTVDGKSYTATVAADGSWTVSLTSANLADNSYTPSITSTDLAGNTTTVPGETFTVDASIPNGGLAPTVEITDDANNDGFVNLLESTADGNTVTDVKIGFDGTRVDVGDIVVATSGGVTKNITITAASKAAGFVTTDFPSPVDGTSIKVDAFIKDAAGNQSATGTDTAKYDLSTLAGIQIQITEDANNDGFINAAELQGTIGVRITLPPTAVAGDLLTVTGTGSATQAVTLTAAQVTAGSVTLEFAPPANGTTFEATAQVTDPAGNQSLVVRDSAVIDTNPVGAPTVTITEDANNDGYINAAELNGNIDTTVTLPATASAGDSLIVTVNGTARPAIVLTAADITAGTLSIPGIASPGEGATLRVEARVDTASGNTGATGSDSAIIDTSNLSLGLAVEITEDINNDGFINATELQGNTVGVRVTLPGQVAVGDTVTVTASGNVNQVFTVTAAQITAGFIDVDFNPTGDNTTFVATATIRDVAGNTGGPVNDQATIQLTIAGAPIVTISEDANNDGYINAAELNGPIDVAITLPATVNVGDKLITTINGVEQPPIVLTLAQVQASSVSITAPNPGEGQTLTVDARVVDVAGNVGNTGSDSAIIDTSIPNGGLAPTVEITDDANNDGFVNLLESTADGNTVTDVKIGFDGTRVDVGDIVVATSGGVTKNITITAASKAAGFVTTDFPSPVDGTSIKVDAFIKDAAGNQSATGTDTAKYDLSTLAGIQIQITEDANNDGFINAAELQGTIGVRITLPPTAVAGDLLTVTGTGSATQAVTLTAAQVTAGSVTLEFAPPANGTTFEATAQVTDPAGNQSLVVRDSAVIDTNPVGAPTVTITEDANNDGYINAAELNGNIDTTVTLPATASAGDSLIVTVNGTARPAIVLTAADITAGTLSIPGIASPGEGATLRVEARVDTASGNTGATGSDSAIIDTSNLSLGLAVEITEDINNDGFINATELQGNTVGVRVTLPGQVAVGDTVTVTASGNVNQVFTVTAAQITAGFIDVDFNPTGDNTTFVATATIRDVAGNTGGPVNDQATIQLTIAGAPIVTISEDANNDGYINAAELNGPIDVAITLPATVNVGDKLITTINGVEQPPIVLTLAQVQASSVSITAPNPGEGQTLTVDARVVDVAGNVGNTGSDSAIIDTSIPNGGLAPTVEITDDANNDGFVNLLESTADGNTVTDVKIGFDGTRVDVGDIVVATSGGVTKNITITAASKAAGFVTTDFPSPVDGTSIKVDAFIKDAAGNQSATGTDTAKYDLSTLAGIQIQITEDANNDGFINAAELQGTIGVRITLPPTAVAGDLLTVTGTGSATQAVTLTAAQVTAGSVTLEFAPPANGTTFEATAQVTDPAGNQSLVVRDSAVIDTNPVGAPTVTITEDANNDGYINAAELNGNIDTTVTLPATASAGDSLIVTVNGTARPAIVLTAADITAGTLSIPGIASPGEGATLRVEARVDTASGNTGATGSDSAIIDTSNLSLGLAVEITEDINNDGFINATELQGNTVGVRVTLPGQVAVGDTVTVTASGNVNQVFTVTAAQITAGFIDVDFNPTGDNTTFVATATIRDVAGNTGGPVNDQATIQLTIAGAPIVTISEDANNDGYINAAELNGPIDVAITLPATVNVGDKLITTINGVEQPPIVLTLAQVQASSVSITAPNPGEGQTLTVDARVVDVAGNVGNTGSDSAIIDTSIPNGGLAPTVEITDDANNDGFVNLLESTADGNTVTDVKIGFDGTRVDVGDIVVATSGGVTKNITITAASKAAGFVTTDFPSPVDGTSIKVDAFIKDAAGNQSATGTDTAKYDLSTLAGIQIQITEDANNDGFINAAELQGTIGVRITLPPTAVAGDLLTVTGTGSATQAVTLTAAQVTAGSVTLEFAPPANGTTFEATAQVTDPAGNQSLVVRDSAVIDTNPVGAPTVTITEDANNDGYINAAELNGNIDTTVTLPATASAGDSLIVTVNGTARPAIVLTAADITAGTLSIPGIASPGEGATLRVEARVDTASGNTGATGSDSAIIDTSNLSLGLAVEITEDINNDGFINATELQGNTVGVRVTLPGQVAVGDTVTVTASGNVNQVFTVTAAQITAGFIDVDFNPTGDNTTFVATATIRDVAGNTGGPVNDQATIQLTIAGAPIVTISEDANNDGYINAAELNGPIDVAITLPATVNVGDKLITTINGVEQPPIVLTLAQVQASSVSITAPNPGEGQTLTVDARVVDVAGNVGNTGSDSAIIDTTPPVANAISGELPETAIDDTGLSNTDNVTANRTPTLRGTTELSTDKVEVTIDGKNYTATVTNDGTGKGLWSVPLTTNLPNGTFTPSIKVTDLAGNTTTKNAETFTVVAPTAVANVSEEGLQNAIPDTLGTTDTTNATVATGTMNVNVGTVTLTAPIDALTSGGVAVTWTGSGTNTIVGSANGAEVIRATINNNGNYTVTLSKAIDHATAGVEDVKSLGFGVRVTDASGGINTGSLTVNVEDDSPVAPTSTVSLNNQPANTNLSIIIDLSGSMGNASGLTSVNRLEVTKVAIKELIDGYSSYGNVMVNMTVFGSTAATTGVWVSAANAINFIDTLSANLGGTNYDAALAQAMIDFAKGGKLTAPNAENVLYFLSDGQPQTGDGNDNALLNVNGGSSAGAGINAAETTIWQNFLNSNGINAFAFGLGTGVTVTSMNPIAYDGSTGTDRNAEVISDLNVLSDKLASTVVISTPGNLSAAGTLESDFGADGGYLAQLTYGNNTFNYNSLSNSVTRSGAGSTAFSYNQATNILTLTTLGGSYQLNLLTGAYNYVTTALIAGVSQEVFGYTLADYDGDTSSGSLTVNLDGIKTAPVANDDRVIVQLAKDDPSTVTVKDAWLLWNDTDRDGDVLNISSVTNATSHTNGQVVDSLSGSNYNRTGSFEYVASDPDGNTNSAKVNISVTKDSTINGNGLDNILIGGSGNDTLNGFEGDDVLVGGAGNDTLNGGSGRDLLIGGKGNDILTGGTGADVFKWDLGDNGTTASPARDVVTDFNLGQGDALNLKDLLIGENVGNITNFLHFEQSGVNTILHVSHTGGFAGGFNASQDTQTIQLNNVSLTDLGGANDAAIIQSMLTNNQLIVDQ